MVTITDTVILIAVVYYAYAGWRKGLLRSLLKPSTFVICLIWGYVYYLKHHNFILSIGIAVVLPTVISFFLSAILYLWNKAGDRDKKTSRMNRLIGSCISLTWGVGMIVLMMVLVLMIPSYLFGVQKAREDILQSKIFALFPENLRKQFAHTETPEKSQGQPLTSEDIEELPGYDDLMKDDKVQELVSDEETLRQMKEKDFGKLLNNPKLLAILEDKELLAKFFHFYKNLNERGMLQETSPSYSNQMFE